MTPASLVGSRIPRRQTANPQEGGGEALAGCFCFFAKDSLSLHGAARAAGKRPNNSTVWQLLGSLGMAGKGVTEPGGSHNPEVPLPGTGLGQRKATRASPHRMLPEVSPGAHASDALRPPHTADGHSSPCFLTVKFWIIVAALGCGWAGVEGRTHCREAKGQLRSSKCHLQSVIDVCRMGLDCTSG